jgi:EpsI family protein
VGEPIIHTKTLNESPAAQRTFPLVVALIVAIAIVYWPSVTALWRYWIYLPSLGGHGSLVVVLAAWMLLRSKDRINSTPRRPALWALLPLALLSVAWLVFWKAGIQSLHLMILPVLIFLAVLSAFGGAMARAVVVPLAYLYFSMPAWNLLSTSLQHLTVRIVTLLAPAFGLPATVSGSQISFPNGATFVVTLACSGIAFLVQGLAVAALLGELEKASIKRRLALLISMAIVALMTNWLRVLLLLKIGYSWGMDNPLVANYHLEFGYVLFVIALIGFVWLATRGPLPARSPTNLSSPDLPTGRWVTRAYVAAVVTLTLGPLAVLMFSRQPSGLDAPRQLRLPTGHDDWSGPFPVTTADWRPTFVGPHSEQHLAYEDGQHSRVEVLVIGYARQTQDQKLINEENSLFSAGALSPLDFAIVRDADEDSYQEILVADEAGHRSVIWTVYDVGGQSFVIPLFSQLWYGLRSLHAPPYSALFAFRAECALSCDEARATLKRFVRGMGEAMIAQTAMDFRMRAGVSSTGAAEPRRAANDINTVNALDDRVES